MTKSTTPLRGTTLAIYFENSRSAAAYSYPNICMIYYLPPNDSKLSIIDMTDAVSSVANCGKIQIMSYNVLVMNTSKQEVTHSKSYVNTFNDSTPL